MKFSDREILERLRVEFDHLWNYFDRDNGCSDPDKYYMFLETTILNRLQEAGLERDSCGTGGVASWNLRKAL